MRLASIPRLLAYGLLALLTLEIAARVEDKLREGAPLLGPYTIETLFRPSPHGREGIPGARFGKWRLNSLGYRGPELQLGRTIVVTYGASETFGLYESPEQEFPRALERILNAELSNTFGVVNIALPGIRIGRTAYLSQALKLTKPSYVVIYPSPANYIGSTVPFCGRPSSPVSSSPGLGDHIRLVGKLSQQAKRLIPPDVMTPIRLLAIEWGTRYKTPISRVPDETISAMSQDLKCVVEVIRKQNSMPILVTHATYFGELAQPSDSNMLLAWRRFYPELREEGFLDLERRANEEIRAIAKDQGVLLVDAATSVPRGPKFFADFVHFTDEGAAMLAQEVARTILNASPSPSVDRQ